MKMELIEGSRTSAFRTQTSGNYPKENILLNISGMQSWCYTGLVQTNIALYQRLLGLLIMNVSQICLPTAEINLQMEQHISVLSVHFI